MTNSWGFYDADGTLHTDAGSFSITKYVERCREMLATTEVFFGPQPKSWRFSSDVNLMIEGYVRRYRYVITQWSTDGWEHGWQSARVWFGLPFDVDPDLPPNSIILERTEPKVIDLKALRERS